MIERDLDKFKNSLYYNIMDTDINFQTEETRLWSVSMPNLTNVYKNKRNTLVHPEPTDFRIVS